MLKRILLGVVVIVSLAFTGLTAMVLWAIFFGHSSIGGTLANGRSIDASADTCYIGMETNGDTAIIRTFGGSVQIGPREVRVNDRTVDSIPVATKSVSVTINNGEVSFIADGKPIGVAHRY